MRTSARRTFRAPGLIILEKLVGTARENDEREIHWRLMPLLDESRMRELDKLLKPLEPHRPSPLAWLRNSATANTPQTILEPLVECERLTGSLKQGYVTACLLASKMQSSQKQNALTKTLQGHGRLQKTVFILKYVPSPEYQKRVTGQLNKGEAMHALRDFCSSPTSGTSQQ